MQLDWRPLGQLLPYRGRVELLKRPRLNYLWRLWRAQRGEAIGDYGNLHEYVRAYAPARTFADIGCMWGADGKYAFLAEEVGALSVKALDVNPPTLAFEEEHRRRRSSVEFIRGDACKSENIRRVGTAEVVLCAALLQNQPSPIHLLSALRQMCAATLILQTATIPEVPGLLNAAVYYPMLPADHRRLWNLERLGAGEQVAISSTFSSETEFSNWYWGLTPSCVESLLATTGFCVEHRAVEAFARTYVCSITDRLFPPSQELPNGHGQP